MIVVIVTMMCFHCLDREDQCQNTEDQSLCQPNDDFKTNEHARNNGRYEERHNHQNHTTCEQVTEQTEGEAHDLTNFGDDFDQTDYEINQTEWFLT